MESIFCKILILHIIVFIFPVIMSQNPGNKSIPLDLLPGLSGAEVLPSSLPFILLIMQLSAFFIYNYYNIPYYTIPFLLSLPLCSYAYKTDSHPITPKHVL